MSSTSPARPGVRTSWGPTFDGYLRDNLSATQRVFEAAVERGIRVVYASSSSVYGDAETYPLREDAKPMPVSPYGVSKLACEALAGAYASSVGLDAVGMRFFSVYGPRQRPDMAFAAVFDCLARSLPFRMFGSGRQSRDFTFVGDVVEATLAAMQRAPSGRVYNVGGGSEISLLDALALCERIVGRRLELDHVGAGDRRRAPHARGLRAGRGRAGLDADHVLGGRPARPGREHRRAGGRAGRGRWQGPSEAPRARLSSSSRFARTWAAPSCSSSGSCRACSIAGFRPRSSRGRSGDGRARSRSPARWCAARRSPGESPLASLVYVAAALGHLLRRRSGIDLVHAHGALSPATIALGGRLLGLPCLVTVLGTGPHGDLARLGAQAVRSHPVAAAVPLGVVRGAERGRQSRS